MKKNKKKFDFTPYLGKNVLIAEFGDYVMEGTILKVINKHYALIGRTIPKEKPFWISGTNHEVVTILDE